MNNYKVIFDNLLSMSLKGILYLDTTDLDLHNTMHLLNQTNETMKTFIFIVFDAK